MNTKGKKTLTAALSCWICHGNYDEDQKAPLVLQCGHCFCKDCLIRIFTSSSPPTALPCPECRHVSSVGNSVSSLPKNFSLLPLLSHPSADVTAEVTDSDASDEENETRGNQDETLIRKTKFPCLDISRQGNLRLVQKLSDGRRVGVEVWKGVVGGGGTGRQVAVKRVKIGEGMDVDWMLGELERLRRASMWCRNVCGFHGAMVVDGHLCLVMDKGYGSVQLEMQRNEGRLTLKQILRYFFLHAKHLCCELWYQLSQKLKRLGNGPNLTLSLTCNPILHIETQTSMHIAMEWTTNARRVT